MAQTSQEVKLNRLQISELHNKLTIEGIYGLALEDAEPYKRKLEFFCTTSRMYNIFMMDIFVINYERANFTIKMNKDYNFLNDQLSSELQRFQFFKNKKYSTSYIKSYSFTMHERQHLNKGLAKIPIIIEMFVMPYLDNKMVASVFLKHSFAELLKDTIDSDFTIESYDGCKYRVHKMILGVHSDVFKAMFDNQMVESQNNFAKLADTKEDLDLLFEYIYTGGVTDVMQKDCQKMLMLADKYDLPGLRVLAENALVNVIDVENAVGILKVSEFYHSEILKNKALEFILLNTSVLETEDWKKLNHPELTKQLFERMVK